MNHARIAIIGAGMAGLGAARTLSDGGCCIVVFEKSRSFGGRLATRCWEGDLVDHGAQYFTVGSSAFAKAVRSCAGGEVHSLDAPLFRFGSVPFPQRSRYYHRRGNNRMAQALSVGIDVRLESMVDSITRVGERWEILGEQFDQVLLTAPLPQSLNLIGVPAVDADIYEPCLTVLLRYWGEWIGLTSSRYGTEHRPGSELRWSACENHKAGRIQPGRTILVAHASAEFSRVYWDDDPLKWGPLLRSRVEAEWGIAPAHYDAQFTHRWKYARRTVTAPPLEFPQGIFYAGDALTESRVEAAWLSGVAAAERILNFGCAGRVH